MVNGIEMGIGLATVSIPTVNHALSLVLVSLTLNPYSMKSTMHTSDRMSSRYSRDNGE